jgi:uncharacterized protein YgiM (DUF1202 family)
MEKQRTWKDGLVTVSSVVGTVIIIFGWLRITPESAGETLYGVAWFVIPIATGALGFFSGWSAHKWYLKTKGNIHIQLPKIIADKQKPIFKAVVVSTGTLNVRRRPEKADNIVSSLKRGVEVTVLEESGDWSRIDKGWVQSQFLTKKEL